MPRLSPVRQGPRDPSIRARGPDDLGRVRVVHERGAGLDAYRIVEALTAAGWVAIGEYATERDALATVEAGDI